MTDLGNPITSTPRHDALQWKKEEGQTASYDVFFGVKPKSESHCAEGTKRRSQGTRQRKILKALFIVELRHCTNEKRRGHAKF